jgi:UDP-N-acetylmuramyl pentapeptide phosphotransferase/UDP-N-acetylglucosamine-1-phosphate transferase
MKVSILTPLLISTLFAFAGSLIALKSISPFASKLGLLDHPDNRKQHVDSIPLVGGIAITLGALIAFVVFQLLTTTNTTTTANTTYIMLGGVLMLGFVMAMSLINFSQGVRPTLLPTHRGCNATRRLD